MGFPVRKPAIGIRLAALVSDLFEGHGITNAVERVARGGDDPVAQCVADALASRDQRSEHVEHAMSPTTRRRYDALSASRHTGSTARR